MKRIIPALAFGLLVAGCTNSRSDLVVQGVIAPAVGTCTFAPGNATAFLSERDLNVRVQQILFGDLSEIIGFQVVNNLDQAAIQDSTARTVTDATMNDVVLTEMDITATDASGNPFATTTVVANGYVPGPGQGVTIPDVMGKPLADAVRKLVTFPAANPASQTLVLSVVLKGNLVQNGSVESEPFQYPLKLRFDDPFQSAAGNAIQTIAILADGGYADEVVFSDGTAPQLGDAVVAADGSVTVTNAGSRTYADPVILAAEGAVGQDGGLNLPGIIPCD